MCIQNRKVQNSLRSVGNCFAISSKQAISSSAALEKILLGPGEGRGRAGGGPGEGRGRAGGGPGEGRGRAGWGPGRGGGVIWVGLGIRFSSSGGGEG
jgi:hypothetical protein